MTARRKEYEKGDNRAGGGGGVGGGGKQTRPHRGWEKGDVARQVHALRPEEPIPRKPGRVIEDDASSRAEPEPEPELPILDALRRTNAKLLTTLRKLDGTHGPDERVELSQLAVEQLAAKREIESRMLTLLDATVVDAIDELRRLDTEIDRNLALLHERPPRGPAFGLAVQTLFGAIELQIDHERTALEPAWAAMLDPDQAAILAKDLRP